MYMYFNTFWKEGIMSFCLNLYKFGKFSTFSILCVHAFGILFNGLHGQSFTQGCNKYAPQSDPYQQYLTLLVGGVGDGAGCRGGRWGWTVVTLGARWPLLCPPFVLYIGLSWSKHGPVEFSGHFCQKF